MGADKDTCDTAKMHIADIDSTFTNMANDLSSDITGVEKKISSVDVQINKLEMENAKLTKKLSSALNLDAGAQGQITDGQLLYNQDLVANWILGLSMVGFVVILLLTRDVSAEAVKTQTRALAQQASRTFPGVTSMIPGM
jgi:septal ring factor EnvC (AmiA/AmiB activator)